jgi:hypothetical protein
VKREISISHEFVEFIPPNLKEGTIYVSIPFATAVHKCFCGCGQEVVTPLNPTDWKLIFDGVTISLDPSIGNWSFDCQSHYWIKRNKVIWAHRWSEDEINAGRTHDRFAKEKYFGTTSTATDSAPKKDERKPERNFWQKIKEWWA